MNTDKKYETILEVYVHDEFVDNKPDKAKVTITQEFFEKDIKPAIKFLKKHKALSVSYFDGIDMFYNNETDEDYEETGKLVEYEDFRADLTKLVIHTDSIHWAGCIKNTSIQWETDSISIKELEQYFDVISMSEEEIPLILSDDIKYDSVKEALKSRINNRSTNENT